MTIISLSASLIKLAEGLRLTAYRDSAGVPTIGFGHCAGVKMGDTITEDQAEAFFQADAAPLLELVKHLPIIEAAALLSFGFNCGLGALQRYLAGTIVARDGAFWAGNLQYGRMAGGVISAGLVSRRRLEASLIEASKQG
jgi:lysozyme